MKKISLLIAALVLVFLGYVVASPYIAVNEIRLAAKSHDAQTLNRYIEFDSVRASLKEQLNAKIAKEITGDADIKNNPLLLFGSALASGLVEKMVDAYITPTGIAQMLEGSKPNKTITSTDKQGATETVPSEKDLQVSSAYKSLDTFVLSVVNTQQQTIEFVLRRNGLAWKVTNIILPEK